MRRYSLIANVATLHQKPNDTAVDNYRRPYGLRQAKRELENNFVKL